MPKIAYSEAEREQVREALITAGLELFVQQGIQHTTVEQIYQRVGISRTFFYSFFPAKEDLVVQVFLRQQPKIAGYARKLMEDPALSWSDGVRQFLHDLCYVHENRFAIMTVEEQQAIFKHLSVENYHAIQQKQITLFADVLEIFGIRADEMTAKLVCNLVLPIVIVRKAIPDTLPFLFVETADAMVDFQIDALLSYLENLHKQQNIFNDTEEVDHGNF